MPINQQLVKREKWDEEAIQERADELFRLALNLWPGPDLDGSAQHRVWAATQKPVVTSDGQTEGQTEAREVESTQAEATDSKAEAAPVARTRTPKVEPWCKGHLANRSADRVDSRPAEPSVNADQTWTGLWHFNIGDVPADAAVGRNWDDERRYGFLSAGQGSKWREEISRLAAGDRVYAYLNGAGYVGGGVITSPAAQASIFVPPGFDKPLRDLPLKSQGWFLNGDDLDMAEYMVGVEWSRMVDPSEGVRVSPAIRGTVRKIWSADLAQKLRAAFG